jgi:hypothetical protein
MITVDSAIAKWVECMLLAGKRVDHAEFAITAYRVPRGYQVLSPAGARTFASARAAGVWAARETR